jgi:hypothetical protein
MTVSNLSLYPILRLHAMGELQNESAETLTQCQVILKARIAMLNMILTTTNLFKPMAEEIRADVRWYTSISEEIGHLLTAEIHQN